MAWLDFFWYDENIEHLAEHGITPEEFEHVLRNPRSRDESDSSGRPIAKGYTPDGRWIICVYEMIDDVTVLPVTAYEPGTDD